MKNTYHVSQSRSWLIALMWAIGVAVPAGVFAQNPLTLTQPTYNCQIGSISFNTTGGDGTIITYTAPGIMRAAVTNSFGTVEPGLRADPKPIVIQATQSGRTTAYTFDLKAYCNTNSQLPSPILASVPDQTLTANTLYTYPAIEISSNAYNPAVDDRYLAFAITATGLPPGMQLTTSVLMRTALLVSINGRPTTPGTYPVTVTATNTVSPGNAPYVTRFTITVVGTGSGTGLTLTQPTYTCQTGAITFNTSGGNGSPISFSAPGISRASASSNSGTVEPGLRADPKPITIQATQSGQTTSYTFDLKAFCATTPPISVTNPDAGPLIDLYNATNGPNWTNKTNWLNGGSPCNWYGVSCDGNGRVSTINLGFNNLDGTIPASIGNLNQLKSLIFFNANLRGSLPAELGNLSQLQSLNIEYTQISGPIPASLGNLTNLESLFLAVNQLSGSIPASLGSLPKLQYLYLFVNQLSGCIPNNLVALCGKDIRLYGNTGLPNGGDFTAFCANGAGACSAGGPLVLTQPTYNCQTGAITFNTSGGNGSPISFSAPGISRASASSNSGTVEPGLRADPKPITIQATQSGQTTGYVFDLKAFCASARVGLADSGNGLSVQVLGNPAHEQVRVRVTGAEGQAVQFHLTDLRGRLIESRFVEQAKVGEEQQFRLEQAATGILLLQAITDRQTQTVKIINQ